MIRALIFAPLAGAAVILSAYFFRDFYPPLGFASWAILAAIVPAWCYAAEAVLVLPIMLVWPAARRPSLPIAAVWGGVTACIAGLAVDRPTGAFAPSVPLRLFLGYGSAGAVAGLVYAYLVSRVTAMQHDP